MSIPDEAIERTSSLTFTRDCSLCGGDMHVINGERQRHTCKIPGMTQTRSNR